MIFLIRTLKKLNRRRIEYLRDARLRLLKLIYKPHKKRPGVKELRRCKTIAVIISGNGFGDALIMSGALRVLKENGFDVTVIAQEHLESILKRPELSDHFVALRNKKKPSADGILAQTGGRQFDLMVDLMQREYAADNMLGLKLYHILKPKYYIGFNDRFGMFDIDVRYDDKNMHVSRSFGYLFKALGLKPCPTPYYADIPQHYADEAKTVVDRLGDKKIVCINPFASDSYRSFSVRQVEMLLDYLEKKDDVAVVIVGEQYKLNKIRNIIKSGKFYINRLEHFFHMAYIVKSADIVISTDTSVVHLANAYNKNLICVYNNKKTEIGARSNIIWSPDYENAVQLFTKDDLGDSNGDMTSRFDVREIFPYLDEFLEKKKIA